MRREEVRIASADDTISNTVPTDLHVWWEQRPPRGTVTGTLLFYEQVTDRN